MYRTVNFYYCTALPIIRTVPKNQACNIYKYWSYDRNLRVGTTYKNWDATSERLWTPLCHYFPLQQHALVTSSKRKELLFCSKCSSEISPALNNWTLHKSRVFSPHSHSIRAGVYYIPNCNTPKQMMKSTNIFMLPISIFICLFFFIQGHFCLQVYSNCLLGGCMIVWHYDGRKIDGPRFNYCLTCSYLTKLVKWMKHLFLWLIFVEYFFRRLLLEYVIHI